MEKPIGEEIKDTERLKKEIEKIEKEIFWHGLIYMFLNIGLGYLFVKNLINNNYIRAFTNFACLSITQYSYTNYIKSSARLEMATENLIRCIEQEEEKKKMVENQPK